MLVIESLALQGHRMSQCSHICLPERLTQQDKSIIDYADYALAPDVPLNMMDEA